jgi:hypothetical protein
VGRAKGQVLGNAEEPHERHEWAKAGRWHDQSHHRIYMGKDKREKVRRRLITARVNIR